MENDDDYRKHLEYAFRMIAFIVVCFWIMSMFSGCSSNKRTVVSEEVVSLDIDGIRRISSNLELYKSTVIIDSVSRSGSWRIVVYDTDKAVMNENGEWTAPVKETFEGESEQTEVNSSRTDLDGSSIVTEEDSLCVNAGEIGVTVKNRDVKIGSNGAYAIFGALFAIVVSFLVFNWCRKHG